MVSKKAKKPAPRYKPCPFCGTNAGWHVEFWQSLRGRSKHQVRCEACGASGPVADTERKGVEAWNHRDYPLPLIQTRPRKLPK